MLFLFPTIYGLGVVGGTAGGVADSDRDPVFTVFRVLVSE